jgi:hypothetical protein
MSSSQGSFAAKYPEKMARASSQLRARETKAREETSKMLALPDKLKDTDWDLVEKIVDASDKAGKDGGYAAQAREQEQVQTFFDEEREEIVKKVGGSVQYAAKQKGCEADAWGAVSTSLKDSIEERMRERLRDGNDAFILIERHQDKLGKKNIPALEEGADGIAMASYVVHVEMPEGKAKLEAIRSGTSSAKSALEDAIEEEKEFQAKGSPSPEEAKSSDARVKEFEKQLGALQQADTEAEENLKDLEARTKTLAEDYKVAMDNLKTAIASKKTTK